MNDFISLFVAVVYFGSIIYTFMVWGTVWGFVSFLCPIVFPMIDFIAWIIPQLPWL